ncbi:TPA: LOW QUALITY PROTEIN: hypothetical protein N0F65_006115 [Lagenidium giganteum]|uniref:Glucosylceramidase n=1 Tax=Lagenidium giganteum TaxID=4803 RepID=A0AAV2Z534_9STRA|nr:TPA: LOW QUALITY PROTEIN: hypothetical protein N0F65_006115 [Lagenidium giganteum]
MLASAVAVAAQCASWSSRFGTHLDGVCVCNVTHPCANVSNAHLELAAGDIGVFETSKAGSRLNFSKLAWSSTRDTKLDGLTVDTRTTYQSIVGFGGAFTDAAAIGVYKLDSTLPERVLRAYFTADGLEYSLGRVPIASCDFSESVYSYNPVEDDLEMKHFSIDVDRAPTSHKLDLIHRTLNMTSRNLTLFASSWAPPTWMTRENKTENCQLKGTPGDKYWDALALYYSKFIDADEDEGIKIWGMTVQNEPIKQPLQLKAWQSLRLTAELERDFVKKNLGPMMAKNHPNLKLLILDDQKDEVLGWNASFADDDAKKYVHGIGVHWYKDVDFVLDPKNGGNFEELTKFHALHPDMLILATEACEGYLPNGLGTGAGTKLNQSSMVWQRGENYARDVINDLAHFASGWTDWNLVLDTDGGPNWAGNLVDAPILVDERNGSEYYQQPMYYVLGHFSKFLPPGSVRVALTINSTADGWDKVDKVAFVTPANQTVVILSNRNSAEMKVQLADATLARTASITLPANAIQTIIFRAANGTKADGNSLPKSLGMAPTGSWAFLMMSIALSTFLAAVAFALTCFTAPALADGSASDGGDATVESTSDDAIAFEERAGSCDNWSQRFQQKLEGVCVCSLAKPCDEVTNDHRGLKAGQVGVYTTSKQGDRLRFTTLSTTATEQADLATDMATTYQKIIGFGGAFTDAAAINVYRLDADLQQWLLDAYYSDRGLQYSLGRIPIASCDFSEREYSYNPVVDDFAMKHFSIDVDRAPNSHKLELIQRAINISSRHLTMFASSWAPPVWLTRENRTGNCHVKGSPGDKHWKALALYYSKFVDAYEAEGIKIWGMTVQNEPGKPIIQPSVWQSLRLSPEEERDFIKKDLGPLMRERHPELKIIAHDDQKPDIKSRLAPFQDPDARQYISGIGVHWYKDLDFFFFGVGGDFKALSDFHAQFPDMLILPTEACEGFLPKWLGTGVGVKLHDYKTMWKRAENYAHDILNDLLNFASGWTDWNIALDTNGGPNWAKNFVDAPIVVDEQGGKEFYKQPMYYILGHFAKFLPAGSVRVELTSVTKQKDLERVAFVTPDNWQVVILFNRKSSSRQLKLRCSPQQVVTLTLAAQSLHTVMIPPASPASSFSRSHTETLVMIMQRIKSGRSSKWNISRHTYSEAPEPRLEAVALALPHAVLLVATANATWTAQQFRRVIGLGAQVVGSLGHSSASAPIGNMPPAPQVESRLVSVVRHVLPLSLIAIGGRSANLALAHDHFVHKLGWLTDERFLEVFSITSAAPGPSSVQTFVAIGMLRAGPIGGLLALVCFVLPGWIVMTCAGLGTRTFTSGGMPLWLTGLGPAVVGLVVVAAARLWTKACGNDRTRAFVAGLTSCTVLATQETVSSVIFPVLILGGGVVTLVAQVSSGHPPEQVHVRKDMTSTGRAGKSIVIPSSGLSSLNLFAMCRSSGILSARVGAVLVATWVGVLILLGVYRSAASTTQHDMFSMFCTFYWIGAMSFNGDQTLPIMLVDLVQPGWVSKEQLLAGYALVKSLPGPFFNISAFLGAVAFGPLGAVVASMGFFGPGILLLYGLLPLWEHVRDNCWLRVFLTGVNAAAAGLVVVPIFTLWNKSVHSNASAMTALATGLLIGIFSAPTWLAMLFGGLLHYVLTPPTLDARGDRTRWRTMAKAASDKPYAAQANESYLRRLWSVVREIVPLSLISFGGPPAHLALAHDRFVYDLQWLTDERFLEVLSIASAIPGPSSTQVITSMGLFRAGPLGGLIALIFWMLPGWIVMTVAGMGAKVYLHDGMPDWMAGLAPAAVSLVVIASVRLWQKAVGTDNVKAIIATMSSCVVLATQGMSSLIFPIIMAAGGSIMMLSFALGYSALPQAADVVAMHHLERQIGIRPWAGVLVLLVWLGVLILLTVNHPQDGGEHTLLSMFYTFYWIGSVIFGGGQVMLPMLLNDIVNRGWVSKDQFLAGFALIQSLPGPLFNISAYLGSVLYGPVGALLAALGLFGPGVVLFFGLLPLWERVRENAKLKLFLSGVNASATGLVVASVFLLWEKAVHSQGSAAVGLATGLMVGVFNVPASLAIGAGALIGFLLTPSVFNIGQKNFCAS